MSIENRDYTIIIDKSGSMSVADCANGQTRWQAAQESAEAVARKCETVDPDGITVYVFSSKFKRYDDVTAAKVSEVFAEHEPMGGTGTAEVLHDAFADWEKRKKSGAMKSGDTIVVITDGEPNDREAVAREIVSVSKKMDADEELAVLFLQVGKDGGAAKFLTFLDDDLQGKGAKFDIVDAKSFEEIEEKGLTLSEVLLAAIED